MLGSGEFFDRHRHAFGGIQCDEYELGEDLAVDNDPVAVGRADTTLAVGQSLAKFFVGFILIAQATHQPAAST